MDLETFVEFVIVIGGFSAFLLMPNMHFNGYANFRVITECMYVHSHKQFNMCPAHIHIHTQFYLYAHHRIQKGIAVTVAHCTLQRTSLPPAHNIPLCSARITYPPTDPHPDRNKNSRATARHRMHLKVMALGR